MKGNCLWLLRAYYGLLRCYPRAHRGLFAEEMAEVFAQALADAAARGWGAILRLCLRELRDLPGVLLCEHWFAVRQWLGARCAQSEPMRTDLPGLVSVGDGSVPHLLFAVTGLNPRIRRLFDVALAFLGLAIAAPCLLVLPLLIKLDSTGPVFYRQTRLGKAGRPYTLYKFRSMWHSPQTAPSTRSRSRFDPRLTRIGRLLRRHNLDELPQLFNVLRGDMSIFGPPPRLPD